MTWRSALLLAGTAGALLGAGGTPASAAGEPACAPEEVPDFTIRQGFVAGRADDIFVPFLVRREGTGNEQSDSLVYTVAPPARVTVVEQDGTRYPRLDAPVPGPLPVTATWLQNPVSPKHEICRATDTFVVPVFPMRAPAVRREAAELPVAIGPTLTWPCPDATRTTDLPGRVTVRYERGLGKAPDAGSPALELEMETPCDLTSDPQAEARGVLAAGISGFRRERSRKALALFPARARDLRVSVEVRWGAAEAFRHDYAVVSAGRRREAGGGWTPVFLTTEPGAPAAAAVRRYARERRGAAYVSPEQRAARRSPRAYSVSVRGSFSTAWTGGLGNPGDPGCYFVRETGADRATFSAAPFDPEVGGGLRGRIERTYTETRDCPLGFTLPDVSCPQRAPMGGRVLAAVLPGGGLTVDGRRVRGPRVTLGLFGELGGGFCTGWGGLLPSAVLDAPAAGVARLRVGRSATLPLARTLDCRDAVVESRGEPTACTVRVAATVRVRRVR